jgi:hypothetical protein
MKSIDPGLIRLGRAEHVAGHDAIVTRGGRCHLRNGFLNRASQPMTGAISFGASGRMLSRLLLRASSRSSGSCSIWHWS